MANKQTTFFCLQNVINMADTVKIIFPARDIFIIALNTIAHVHSAAAQCKEVYYFMQISI